MNNKLLVLVTIFLFFGVAFAPSIHANISKESELVEFTSEVCGLPGQEPQKVQLSQEDAEAVDRLFEEIKLKLDAVESRAEAVEIFNEAVVELDKYWLLGGLSIKQAQRLVTGWYQNPKVMNVLEKLNHKPLDVNENRNCLISGKTDNTYYQGSAELIFDSLMFLIAIPIDILLEFEIVIPIVQYHLGLLLILGWFAVYISGMILLWQIQEEMPACIGGRIGIGGGMEGHSWKSISLV